MKIFGLSVTTLAAFVFFFWIGTKFPNAFNKVPFLGK